MNKQEKAAKIIRIITVPPVLVTLMMVILYVRCPYIFYGTLDFIISLLWLGLCPVLAYPLQNVLPVWKEKGREGQRSLAFVCSVIGYVAAVIYGEAVHVSPELKLIFITYLLSVILLVLLNKICKKRASGHACSITGPLIFLVYYCGWKIAFLCIVIGTLSFWASLKLKRHMLSDLVTGSVVCFISFAIALLLKIK